MFDQNALRRYLQMGGRPGDLGLSVDDLTGDMQEPAPQGNALREMMAQSQGNVLAAPQTYNSGGSPTASVNGDFGVYPGVGQPDRVDLTQAVQQAAQQRQASQATSGPTGGPMRVVGAGNGSTVELSPEVAPAKVDLDYSRPAVDVPGVGKVYYDKSGRGAYAVDGNGRPTTKVILGYDMQGSMALNKADAELAQTKAQTAHTRAQTGEIGSGRYSPTPDGGVLNTRTGQVSGPVMSSQVDRQKQKASYDAGLKELQKDEQQAQSTTDIEAALKRWSELQGGVTTGRIAGHLPAIMQPDRQELARIENYLAMNNFKPGQGSMSNFERTLIKGAGPSLTNDADTNANIVRVMMGAVQNTRDKQFFRETYLNANGKLLGADQAWQRYLDENPRYVVDKSGQLIDNPNRQDWQSYFSGGGSKVQPQVTPQISGGPKIGEVRKGYRYKGGPPESPSSWEKM